MTIDLKTLKCGECGSGDLRHWGRNQFICAHCGSVTLVEDDVSERLDQMLEQLKDAAQERLLQEERTRRDSASDMLPWLLGFGMLLAVVAIVAGAAGGTGP